MKKPYLFTVMESHYCKTVFVLFFLLSYFLIPSTVFFGYYTAIALAFMVTFSLSMTCITRNIKEKIVLSKTYKTSTMGAIASALGLSALQVCGVGAPVCGASVGLGVLAAVFPEFFVAALSEYAVPLILLSIIMQLVSLRFMKCFSSSSSCS